jgi:hypothetical protein
MGQSCEKEERDKPRNIEIILIFFPNKRTSPVGATHYGLLYPDSTCPTYRERLRRKSKNILLILINLNESFLPCGTEWCTFTQLRLCWHRLGWGVLIKFWPQLTAIMWTRYFLTYKTMRCGLKMTPWVTPFITCQRLVDTNRVCRLKMTLWVTTIITRQRLVNTNTLVWWFFSS